MIFKIITINQNGPNQNRKASDLDSALLDCLPQARDSSEGQLAVFSIADNTQSLVHGFAVDISIQLCAWVLPKQLHETKCELTESDDCGYEFSQQRLQTLAGLESS